MRSISIFIPGAVRKTRCKRTWNVVIIQQLVRIWPRIRLAAVNRMTIENVAAYSTAQPGDADSGEKNKPPSGLFRTQSQFLGWSLA